MASKKKTTKAKHPSKTVRKAPPARAKAKAAPPRAKAPAKDDSKKSAKKAPKVATKTTTAKRKAVKKVASAASAGHEALLLTNESLKSPDPSAVIEANIAVVNGLFAQHLEAQEISRDALRSYYVDYYLAQMQNGGFSQFVYNASASGEVFTLVTEGLESMGAKKHLALFEKGVEGLVALGQKKVKEFLASEYFGTNKTRDALAKIDDAFYRLQEKEELTTLNARWLKGHADLVALPAAKLDAELKRRGARLPDRARRIAKALAAEPRYLQLIRALCKRAGHELDRVTAGDPSYKHDGASTVAWHFLTDRGHFFMVESKGKAHMLDGKTKKSVASVAAPA